MVNGFHHAALPVADVPRAVKFYDDVLGFEPVGPDDSDADVETADYYWLEAGDGWLNLARRPDATPEPPHELDDPHLAFRATAAEQDAIAARLADRDVPVHESETSLYLRDPDGNLLEFTRWAGPD